MRNLLSIFLICFFIQNMFSQYRSGEVTYKSFQLQDKEDISLPLQFRNAKKKMGAIINTFEFTLKFNRKISIFSFDERLSLDRNEYLVKIAIIATRANRIIYTDIDKKLILEQTAFLDKKFLISSDLDKIQWKLTKEKKSIDDYICYKAIGSLEYISHTGDLKKYNYTAWYTPEIPFRFGPFEFSGLPGLVLEFSNEKLTFTAYKIKLHKNEFSIEKPTEGKLVSRDEYNQIGKKVFEDHQN